MSSSAEEEGGLITALKRGADKSSLTLELILFCTGPPKGPWLGQTFCGTRWRMGLFAALQMRIGFAWQEGLPLSPKPTGFFPVTA
jgi:hypothetical protein